MSDSEGCGCLIILVAIVLVIALITNPSIEQAKEKFESDFAFRNKVINQGDVRLYRAGYFVFSQYYIGIGDQSPYHFQNGAFLMFFNDNMIINSYEFDESIELN